MIEIKNRYTDEIMLSGEYESIKNCLEKNKDTHLVGAYLRGAYLRDADLRDADLRDADLGGTHLRGAYLRGAYLRGADLGDADLRGANLVGAYLGDADLGGAKNYVDSHDIFKEIIRRQPVKTFTNPEWSIIGQILVHTLCWDSIKKRYGKKIMPLFKKLSELGFDEWEKYYTLKEKE